MPYGHQRLDKNSWGISALAWVWAHDVTRCNLLVFMMMEISIIFPVPWNEEQRPARRESLSGRQSSQHGHQLRDNDSRHIAKVLLVGWGIHGAVTARAKTGFWYFMAAIIFL